MVAQLRMKVMNERQLSDGTLNAFQERIPSFFALDRLSLFRQKDLILC